MDWVEKTPVYYVSREPSGRWIVREQGKAPLSSFYLLPDAWDYANALAKTKEGARAMLDQGPYPPTNNTLRTRAPRALGVRAEQPRQALRAQEHARDSYATVQSILGRRGIDEERP